ncbi:uncharacterized protein AMSG_00685 [Thecamonas trahens ATCC 50062]|uniref:Uncharacterized protein n=1 Tax=Thecamonas trahens ATCC 50062 TaxID=461836 RepID=A0A0L0DE02_THETB|nr:hypothetical protein AMSG_00685 [Thecamonas trahens ATCC 50062]KNC50524.1 hypothetical protein AMSG_00685 [Thecamonas trahens ATCC 50062]|eukprot:XP_013762416.1 hypothetical protein AMSG_00685 [Thecamonas trahens ATCC 50062]
MAAPDNGANLSLEDQNKANLSNILQHLRNARREGNVADQVANCGFAGRHHLRRNKPREALPYFVEQLRLAASPLDTAWAHRAIGSTYAALGDFDKAYASHESDAAAAAGLEPVFDDPGTGEPSCRELEEFRAAVAMGKSAQAQYDAAETAAETRAASARALAAFEAALTLARSLPAPATIPAAEKAKHMIRVLVDLANAYAEAGRYDAGIAAAAEAVELFTSLPRRVDDGGEYCSLGSITYSAFGYVNRELRPEQAIVAYQKARDLASTVVFTPQGKRKKAEGALAIADIHASMGQCYMVLRDYASAGRAFNEERNAAERVYRKDLGHPRVTVARDNYAAVQTARDYTEALPNLKERAAASGAIADILVYLSHLLFLGMHADARDAAAPLAEQYMAALPGPLAHVSHASGAELLDLYAAALSKLGLHNEVVRVRKAELTAARALDSSDRAVALALCNLGVAYDDAGASVELTEDTHVQALNLALQAGDLELADMVFNNLEEFYFAANPNHPRLDSLLARHKQALGLGVLSQPVPALDELCPPRDLTPPPPPQVEAPRPKRRRPPRRGQITTGGHTNVNGVIAELADSESSSGEERPAKRARTPQHIAPPAGHLPRGRQSPKTRIRISTFSPSYDYPIHHAYSDDDGDVANSDVGNGGDDEHRVEPTVGGQSSPAGPRPPPPLRVKIQFPGPNHTLLLAFDSQSPVSIREAMELAATRYRAIHGRLPIISALFFETAQLWPDDELRHVVQIEPPPLLSARVASYTDVPLTEVYMGGSSEVRARLHECDNAGGARLDLSNLNLADAQVSSMLPLLARRDSLTALDLSGNILGDVTMTRLAPVVTTLPRLSALSISSNVLGAKGLSVLCKALMAADGPPLAALDVSHNAAAVRDRPTVMSQMVRSLGFALGASGQLSASLTSLDLSNLSLTPDFWSELAEPLARLPALVSLAAGFNVLGLGNALQTLLAAAAGTDSGLAALNTLRLPGLAPSFTPPFGRSATDADERAFEELGSGLELPHTLHTLDLASNRLDGRGLAALAPLLQRAESVTALDISGNELCSLPDLLARLPPNLIRLDVRDNPLVAGSDEVVHRTMLGMVLSSKAYPQTIVVDAGCELVTATQQALPQAERSRIVVAEL